MSSYEFRFIDLFAGIGGIRLAFEMLEGFHGECVFSSEIDKYAAMTYEANFGETPEGDINEIEPANIPEHDVLLAGFPCQPFSIAGVSKYNALGWKHGFQHISKGTLFYNIAEILDYHHPKAFFLENVKNLKSHDGGKTWTVIERTLRHDLGYTIYPDIYDAARIVPQHRERIFIVGFREPIPFTFRPQHVLDARPKLKNILEEEIDAKYTLTDHLWQYLQSYAEKHRLKGNGFGFGLADREGTTRTLSARYYKDGSEILIPQRDGQNPRRLTPRECARLQGFPDDFVIPSNVSDTQAYKQFGNAVAVPIVHIVAQEMMETLRRWECREEQREQAIASRD